MKICVSLLHTNLPDINLILLFERTVRCSRKNWLQISDLLISNRAYFVTQDIEAPHI